ncbi:glutamyl-tRNA reductase [Thermophagus xiamenensis]|uniref:Glutamyl-tRNA reductase n=1 Tax=Thermophagus xiamenensis TaxID=385682 RepID=A0A1I1YQT0_9BACT|nr:glutamyl-tRNA reductase [Thermophagus xiamenensis]SFE21799.1 glutamyl-tRNA reductase [Thermophagus xiamenensis]
MIGIIGLSHKSAPVEVRERYAFNNEDIKKLSASILAHQQIDGIVILSTCNRTELYFSARTQCLSGAIKLINKCLLDFSGDESINKEYFYHYFKRDAVIHLFRLISGLESMVFGEYQIVSQIKDAMEYARELGAMDKVLNRLFIKALEVGKQVRSRTGISRGAFSVSYAAVEKCREHFSDLHKRKILLIGAGETGELVVKNLFKRGCQHISIANRTLSKAQELGQRFNARIVPFDELASAIPKAEIVISSIIGEYMINQSLLGGKAPEHKVMMIDLGVPRNIDPGLAEMKNIRLLNIDDLKKVVVQNEEKKKSYFDTAEQIIESKTDEFQQWLATLKLSPTIQNIITSVHQLNNEGIEAFRSSKSEEEIDMMKNYGEHLADKLSRKLIKNLKETTQNGQKEELIQVINKLFEW